MVSSSHRKRDQLDSLHTYISIAADAEIASRFTDGLLYHIARLTDFPDRGTPRDDIGAGLRALSWRRRVTIAFMTEDTEVVVIGIFYGGRDFASLLRDD